MSCSLTLQYLGQAGFRIEYDGHALLIDPYLSYAVDRLEGFPPGFWTRAYPPPVRPYDLRDISLVLCSHDHLDHADPETLLGIADASPHCRFAGPRPTVALMQQIGIESERTVRLNTDHPIEWHGVQIVPVAAAHEDYDIDPEGYHRFLGYLLHCGGVTLYHAGDTVATPELSARLAREHVDIGLLPVNGADDDRRRQGIVGNMDVTAAAALTERHHFGLLVPMHYDLYLNNGLSDDAFAAAWRRQPGAARIPLKTFRPGESLQWKTA